MYACPRTGKTLRVCGDFLKASDGTVVYGMKDGIPQFLRYLPAEDRETEAQLEALNNLAIENGWERALAEVYGADQSSIRYVTEPSRASFIGLLPLNPSSNVLEIGPGLGQFTALLARRVNRVAALEVVAAQAKFAEQRCRQQGLTNIAFAVGGDDCRLPYIDEAFDVVVLNLVFEWCALRCRDEEFSEVQNRLLSEIARVLKPGGSLYLMTKNRFALRNIIGKQDEHCHKVRFGSALPRWLATVLMRRKGHARPMGMLHSHGALKTMLCTAGFRRVNSFWAAPEMRYPTYYVPTDSESIREARRNPNFVQGESRSSRLLMRFIPAPLVKYFTPGLTFLATKGP